MRQALTMRIRDFEDALQVAAAISSDADFIITRNVADYRESVISLLTPTSFLRRFAAQE